MSRRTPAPGSRTSSNCGKGITGNLGIRHQRARAKVERESRLITSLPRIIFNEQGTGSFTPENEEETEALRLAAKRFDWEVRSDGVVVCRLKLFHYNRRKHDSDCAKLVPKLYFQRGPNGMSATCNNPERSEDLRHGLDVLAKRYGWTVKHDNLAISYVRKPYHRKEVKKAA